MPVTANTKFLRVRMEYPLVSQPKFNPQPLGCRGRFCRGLTGTALPNGQRGSLVSSSSANSVSTMEGAVGAKGLVPFRINQPRPRITITAGNAATVQVPVG